MSAMNCVCKLYISVSSQIRYIWLITLKRHVLKRDLHIDFVFLRRGLCMKPKIKLWLVQRKK